MIVHEYVYEHVCTRACVQMHEHVCVYLRVSTCLRVHSLSSPVYTLHALRSHLLTSLWTRQKVSEPNRAKFITSNSWVPDWQDGKKVWILTLWYQHVPLFARTMCPFMGIQDFWTFLGSGTRTLTEKSFYFLTIFNTQVAQTLNIHPLPTVIIINAIEIKVIAITCTILSMFNLWGKTPTVSLMKC